MSMDKVQLKQEELLDGQVVLSDINPVTNTKSIEDSANGLPMTETISRIWSAINNKLSRIVNSVNGRTGVVVLTSEDVGLGNVDNVSYEEIKQWVLDTFDELFGEGHFRLYQSLTAAKIDAASHGKEYNNIPFYAQSGEPISKDIGGVPQLIDDHRAYIGYFSWNPSTGHVEIGDKKAINVVGWSDNSIVYVADENETFYGNGANPLPIGGIGVNIHRYEDALIVRNPSGVKSESGLAIDKTKLAPRVYYYMYAYKPTAMQVYTNNLLWDAGQSVDNRGEQVEISIDGAVKPGEFYLQLDEGSTPRRYRTGDIVVCSFRNRISGAHDALTVDPANANPLLLFRNTCVGVFTSAPSIDHPDDTYAIAFNSMLPTVGYGLTIIETHRNEEKTDYEVGINISSANINTRQQLGIAEKYSEVIPYNPTPLNTKQDWWVEQHPSKTLNGDGSPVHPTQQDAWINTPWGIDEGGSTGQRAYINSGLYLNIDQTLCIMPMKLVRAGNQSTYESPLGDEYAFDSQSQNVGERWTRPYGSRVANNWHHPYMFFDDHESDTNGNIPPQHDATLLSVNLSKIIVKHNDLCRHGCPTAFYNVSGLKIDYAIDVAYNGYGSHLNTKIISNVSNIINAYDSDNNRDNYFGILDGFDTDGTPYRDLIPHSDDIGHMAISGGIAINIGKYLEIRPSITENSQEYYDGGKVQVRVGHGINETVWYVPIWITGETWDSTNGPIGWTYFKSIWDSDPTNSNEKYQFYCVPAFVNEFLQKRSNGLIYPDYSDLTKDEEAFLRRNIEEIPLLPEFTLATGDENEYYHLLDRKPDDWNENYTSYYIRRYTSKDNFTYVHVEPIIINTIGDSNTIEKIPDWEIDKYYSHSAIPDDWISEILVKKSRLAENPTAYDFVFEAGYQHTSPLDLVTENEVIPSYTDNTHVYHAVWFTKDSQTGKYIPVNFTVSNNVTRTVSADLEYRESQQQWQPNTYYKIKARRVDPDVLHETHTIVWKRHTNRLGIHTDSINTTINPDGSLGIISAVTQYKAGAVYHKNQMVEANGKLYICIRDYYAYDIEPHTAETKIAMNNEANYSDDPTYLPPSEYGRYSTYHAISIPADMEAGYLSNRFSMDAVVTWEPGQSYAYGQLVQYMGYLYLVIKSYGDYKSTSIEDDIDNGYLSDAFNTSKRKILYFRDIRGRSFEFDPMGTIKQRNNEEKYANDPAKLRRIREYEYVKLGPGLRITGGSLPPEVECNKTELRASLLEEVERMSVAEEIMYARTLDPTFGTSAKFEYQSVEYQNSVVFTPGSMYTMGQYIRSGSYMYLCIKNYDDGSGTPYVASDSAAQDVQAGYLAEYSKIYDNAGTIEALTSIEDVMNLDESFLATIETIGENVDEAIIKNTVLSKDSTLTELRTFKVTLDTIRMQLEDPKVFFPLNKEYLLDDWRTLQNRVRAMVLTANNKKDASTTLYPALIQQWFGNGSTVQPTFKAIQAATNDFLQVEIRTLEWLFTTWATMVRNSFELAATFVDDQNANKCDYCACGDADVICNHQCAHCTKNPENNENAYWAYVQVDSGTMHDAVIYDSLNTETHRELFRIPYGTRVVCIPLNSVADWVKVALNGQIGYALKSNFKLAQVFSQISETAIVASVNIFDTYDATGKGITLYDGTMIMSDDTKLGVFHTYVTDIPKNSTLPDERQWEILSSEWTRITLMNDDGAGYTTGYVETARLIFT